MENKRCVIIGASPETDVGCIRQLVRAGDVVVCADGGYVFAEQAGITPHVIIGDFDSSPQPENLSSEIIRLPKEKDDTDTMYCVREFLRRGYKDFLLLGMTGGRPDHGFANLSVLLFLRKNGARGTIADTDWKYNVWGEGLYHIDNIEGHGFAVFPFGCYDCTVSLRGFRYEAHELRITADFPIGTSNEIISSAAQVEIINGTALVMTGMPRLT